MQLWKILDLGAKVVVGTKRACTNNTRKSQARLVCVQCDVAAPYDRLAVGCCRTVQPRRSRSGAAPDAMRAAGGGRTPFPAARPPEQSRPHSQRIRYVLCNVIK
ncbi:hypothetical protein RR46_10351 [Papilio xuthus]|uniref:Uncharacterized protein n=1 Tax=Papilio xuthus TaxID=66420 RepID=A0A194Q133_PAPXU|nr:hypothetical protein RR46_10351 [Papilio xuthus]